MHSKPPYSARALAAFTLGLLLFAARPVAAQTPASAFSHEPHKQLDCVACHVKKGEDLGPARLSEQQCHSCHHTGPVAGACTRCHAPGTLSQGKKSMQSFRLTVSPTPVMRSLAFDHKAHANTQCTRCHQTPPRLSAGSISCSGCHESHHEPDVECVSCHEAIPDKAHGMKAHETCAGAGCHKSTPVQASARTRQVCLTCHQDRVKHYPSVTCTDCHVMPMAGKRSVK